MKTNKKGLGWPQFWVPQFSCHGLMRKCGDVVLYCHCSIFLSNFSETMVLVWYFKCLWNHGIGMVLSRFRVFHVYFKQKVIQNNGIIVFIHSALNILQWIIVCCLPIREVVWSSVIEFWLLMALSLLPMKTLFLSILIKCMAFDHIGVAKDMITLNIL